MHFDARKALLVTVQSKQQRYSVRFQTSIQTCSGPDLSAVAGKEAKGGQAVLTKCAVCEHESM